MSASDKLQNIKAIKQLLAGEHKTQTRKSFYFDKEAAAKSSAESKIIRSVGDRWTETDANGNITYFEQKSGYRVKSDYSWDMQEFRQKLISDSKNFANCPKEKCTCVKPSRLDQKFKILRGMCFDCNIEHETKLKMRGEFTGFAKSIMRENAIAYFKDMEVELEKWKSDIRGKHSFANGDGTIEQWEATNPEQMIEKLDAEFREYRDSILNSELLKIDDHE